MQAVDIAERVVFTDSDKTLHEWTVTAGGYRAVVQECLCGLVAVLGTRSNGTATAVMPMTNCLCRSEAHRNKCDRLVCHRWHRPRVERLARDVARTFRGSR